MKPKLNILLISVSSIFVLLIINACKKYPEDRGLQLKSVEGRLQGEWKIDRIEINDVNMNYLYNDSLKPMAITDYYFWFKYGWRINNESFDVMVINKSSKAAEQAIKEADVGGLEFNIENKKTRFGNSGSFDKVPIKDSLAFKILFRNIFLLRLVPWQIKSLTKKDMILEKFANSSKYRLYFQKVRKK